MYFAPIIFGSFLSPSAAITANLLVSSVNFLSTFIAMYLVDRVGRRVLFVSGGVGMAIFTGIFAILTSSLFNYKTNESLSIALILCVALYVVNFAYSWGPLGWTIPAEIFPQTLRGKGMTLTTLANWVTNFAISKAVPIMMLQQNLNLWGTFAFFASFCGFMTLFVLLCLPETKGVNLEDMESVFRAFLQKPWYEKMKLSLSTGDDDLVSTPKNASDFGDDVEAGECECKTAVH